MKIRREEKSVYLANGFLPPEPVLCVSIDFVLCSGGRGIQTLLLKEKVPIHELKNTLLQVKVLH